MASRFIKLGKIKDDFCYIRRVLAMPGWVEPDGAVDKLHPNLTHLLIEFASFRTVFGSSFFNFF